ncbi:MAG: hypothetical protein HY275_00625 [Gemmatimonadetes bacterium]|nr:hypothetical protein [Gemmatimonadota bacterium]
MLRLWGRTVRDWTAPDGSAFRVEVALPGTSSALVVFHHQNAHLDRYATWQASDRNARAVSARLDARAVLAALTEAELRALWVRSAPREGQAAVLTSMSS